MLAGGKLTKILSSFWHSFVEKFEDNPSGGL
jgi:hypothetical protein